MLYETYSCSQGSFKMAAFSLQLERKVETALVTSGKFDGSHACLVAATSGGSVLVHSPHRRAPPDPIDGSASGRLAWTGELAELRIGKQVTALYTGRLGEDERDVLMVGTSTHLLAYNVEDNADVFYKEMSDGVYSIAVGKLGWLTEQRVVVIGGNCSVTVLDSSGVEVFWTVTGDIVVSLAIFDFDGDGSNELVLGTADFEVRALKGDSVAWEVKETAPVTDLIHLTGRQFGYAVGNGTVGVYEIGQRLWRVKSKYRVVAIRGYDINGDGNEELITGWSSGKVDARIPATGEVVFRVQMNSSVAGIVRADYRCTGRPDLVAISTAGEVRGYGAGAMPEASEPGDKVRELLAKKQALVSELRHRAANPSHFGSRLAVSISCSDGAARLALAAAPGLFVHCAIVFAEGVFDGETFVTRPSRPSGQIDIELRPPKDVSVDVHVKVCVGPMGADLLQVYELTRQLPRFCMYERIEHIEEFQGVDISQDCGVTVEVAERPQRVAIWLSRNLILPEDTEIEVPENGPGTGSLSVYLRGLRDKKIHLFEASATGKVSLRTEDPNFAGEVIHSLAAYLGLGELTAESNFPAEEKRMTEALERLEGLRETESRLRAGEARGAALLRNLLVRTEDARILGDAASAKTRLSQLRSVNSDLIREHEIGANSYADLVRTLRDLNAAIQRVARLRVGKAAANAVAKCRMAIRDGDPRALVLAARQG